MLIVNSKHTAIKIILIQPLNTVWYYCWPFRFNFIGTENKSSELNIWLPIIFLWIFFIDYQIPKSFSPYYIYWMLCCLTLLFDIKLRIEYIMKLSTFFYYSIWKNTKAVSKYLSSCCSNLHNVFYNKYQNKL